VPFSFSFVAWDGRRDGLLRRVFLPFFLYGATKRARSGSAATGLFFFFFFFLPLFIEKVRAGAMPGRERFSFFSFFFFFYAEKPGAGQISSLFGGKREEEGFFLPFASREGPPRIFFPLGGGSFFFSLPPRGGECVPPFGGGGVFWLFFFFFSFFFGGCFLPFSLAGDSGLAAFAASRAGPSVRRKRRFAFSCVLDVTWPGDPSLIRGESRPPPSPSQNTTPPPPPPFLARFGQTSPLISPSLFFSLFTRKLTATLSVSD